MFSLQLLVNIYRHRLGAQISHYKFILASTPSILYKAENNFQLKHICTSIILSVIRPVRSLAFNNCLCEKYFHQSKKRQHSTRLLVRNKFSGTPSSLFLILFPNCMHIYIVARILLSNLSYHNIHCSPHIYTSIAAKKGKQYLSDPINFLFRIQIFLNQL